MNLLQDVKYAIRLLSRDRWLAGALGVGIVLESLLVQTGTRDPITLVTIVVVLVTVALTVSYWPARRATRLDPIKALRYEQLLAESSGNRDIGLLD